MFSEFSNFANFPIFRRFCRFHKYCIFSWGLPNLPFKIFQFFLKCCNFCTACKPGHSSSDTDKHLLERHLLEWQSWSIYLRVGVIRSFHYYPTAVNNIDGSTPARKLAVCVPVVYTPIKQRDKEVARQWWTLKEVGNTFIIFTNIMFDYLLSNQCLRNLPGEVLLKSFTLKCQACNSNRTLLFKRWIHNHYSLD